MASTGDYLELRPRKSSVDGGILGCPRPVSPEYVVDWDGPADPKNPQNWASWKRYTYLAILEWLSCTVGMGSMIVMPVMGNVMKELGINITCFPLLDLGFYLLGSALGALFFPPISEAYGRLQAYHCGNISLLTFTIICALSKSPFQFITFRILVGFAGAAPLTVVGGTVADLYRLRERSRAATGLAIGPLLGAIFGLLIGRALASSSNWRWALWSISIASGIGTLATLAAMRETHPKILLERKADILRKRSCSTHIRSAHDRSLGHWQSLSPAFTRPIRIVVFSPAVSMISAYIGIVLGLLHLLIVTISWVFEMQYGFGPDLSLLLGRSLDFGVILGNFFAALLTDCILRRHMASASVTQPKSEYHLTLMKWAAPVIPVGLVVYSWTAQYKVNPVVPTIGLFIVGFSCFLVWVPSQAYLIDLYGSEGAASVMGASVFVRSLFAAFLPLAGFHLYVRLNYGWGNTMMGLVVLVFTSVPWILSRYGKRMPVAQL
ncbi:MFS general substrate transporter [Aspergillus heteromorphus CBS 117.55]|uniref:MFS general substrate transporter n=1 Tax=Aspergillus heteromorphus CBS 117.55 TaxID=1448321 RepID=A0A317WNF5_9EURO|nr:MFS general substrate transporter [Aspergillus heteromorphus CBS 117.55]PWY87535.1 MFS general substrate transporter [Aspergillus heteromorphus CBS 117.55]